MCPPPPYRPGIGQPAWPPGRGRPPAHCRTARSGREPTACRQAVPCPRAVAAVPRWPRSPALSGRPGRSVAGLAPPLSRYRRPPGGSRHGCLLSTAPPALLLCRAKSSARVLEQREPASTRTSRVSPLGNEMVAPPLSMTSPEAEPSDQIQVASDGSSASRSSA